MTGKRSMFLFYFSISLAILSSALYHFSQKQIPANVNPAISVLVTYAISFGICLGLLYFFPPENGLLAALRQLNWASYVLAFSLVGLEVGFRWSIVPAGILASRRCWLTWSLRCSWCQWRSLSSKTNCHWSISSVFWFA